MAAGAGLRLPARNMASKPLKNMVHLKGYGLPPKELYVAIHGVVMGMTQYHKKPFCKKHLFYCFIQNGKKDNPDFQLKSVILYYTVI